MSIARDLRYGFIARYGAVARLIVLCGGIYLAMALAAILGLIFVRGGGAAVMSAYQYLYLPSDLSLLAQRPWTFLTWMFVHDLKGIFHILFNMLWLFWLGRILRDFAGDRTVYAAFFYGSLGGSIFYLVVYNLSPYFQEHPGLLMGASAGVNGIVLAAATLVPDFTLYLLLFGAVRLKWVAFFMVIIDLVSVLGSNPGGMFAHLGGALMGYLLITLRRNGIDLTQPFKGLGNLGRLQIATRGKGSRKEREPVMQVAHRGGDGARKGAPSQVEIDRILDKISAEGYHKLTREEKQLLEEYSAK